MTKEEREKKYPKARYFGSSKNEDNEPVLVLGFSTETYHPKGFVAFSDSSPAQIRTVAVILKENGECLTCGLEKIFFIN